MWLLRPGPTIQCSLCFVCRDINFWNPEPLCWSPTTLKLPGCEDAHVPWESPRTCAVVKHPLLSQAFTLPDWWVKMPIEDLGPAVKSPQMFVSPIEAPGIKGQKQIISAGHHPNSWPTESMSIITSSFMQLNFWMIYCVAKVIGSTSLPLSSLLWLWWGPPASGSPHCIMNSCCQR